MHAPREVGIVTWQEGAVLGKAYTLGPLESEGHFTATWRAHDKKRGIPATVHAPSQARATDGAFSLRFLQGGKRLRDLALPHLGRVLDVGSHEGFPYVVEASPGGVALTARMMDMVNPCTAAQLVAWIRQAAEALTALHEEGIVHLEVHPAKLWIEGDHDAVLGAPLLGATLAGDAPMDAAALRQGLPHLREIPELKRGGTPTAAVDQYALASMARRVLMSQGDPDPALTPILDRALARDPAQRFDSCVDFARALEGVGTRPKPTSAKAPRAPKPRPNAAVEAGWWSLLAIVAVAIGAFLALRARDEPTPANASHASVVRPMRLLPTWARVSHAQMAEAACLGVPVAFENEFGMRFVLIPGTIRCDAADDGDGTQAATDAQRIMPFYLQATEATVGQFAAWSGRPAWPKKLLRPPKDAASASQGAGFDALGLGGADSQWTTVKPAYWKRTVLDDAGPSSAEPSYRSRTADGKAPEASAPSYPVGWCSPDSVAGFLQWLSEHKSALGAYRLPTAAEWTHATGAGATTHAYWGPVDMTFRGEDGFEDRQVWTAFEHMRRRTLTIRDQGVSADVPVPVGTLRANPWGLFDTLGNVAELCRAPAASEARYVVCGGSFLTEPLGIYQRLELPVPLPAGTALMAVGFRVALDLSAGRAWAEARR